jgi:hypothetical protein
MCVGRMIQCTDESRWATHAMGAGKPLGCFQAIPASSWSPPRSRAPSSTPAGSETPLKGQASRHFFFPFLLCFCHHRLAPLLVATAIEPSPAKATAPSSSPCSRTPPRPHTPANSARITHAAISFPISGDRAPPCHHGRGRATSSVSVTEKSV